MSIDKNVVDNIDEILEALLECEKNGQKCRRCKLRKRGCILFLRDSIAVALKFIRDHIASELEEEVPDSIYS